MTIAYGDAAHRLGVNSGWSLSNLQLQKILFMADMNFVGQGKGRLIDEDFEAWDYGPVLPSLYRECKPFGAKCRASCRPRWTASAQSDSTPDYDSIATIPVSDSNATATVVYARKPAM